MTHYLDARPMIRALYEAPEDFEIRRNCLRHRPSKHWVVFDCDGNARIVARCECMVQRISREHSEQLQQAAATWEEAYWRPLLDHAAAERRVAEINREFASHFRARRRWRAVTDAIRALFGIGPRRSSISVDPLLPEIAKLLPQPDTEETEGRLRDLLSV